MEVHPEQCGGKGVQDHSLEGKIIDTYRWVRGEDQGELGGHGKVDGGRLV